MHSAALDVKCIAYKSLIRPVIEYAKIVWNPYKAINCFKFEKIQRLASKFIFTKYGRIYSSTQLCEQAQLSAVEARTRYERLKFLYLIIYNYTLR